MDTEPSGETVADLRRLLAEREAERDAARAQTAALGEVLRAISASPADPQPVFELIARKVKDLYGAHAVSVVEYDGEQLHQRALIGHEPEAAARLLAAFPRPPGPETGPGRVVLSGEPVYFREIDNESGIIAAGRTASLGVGSYFAVPLLHEGHVIGVLGLWRADFGEFNEALVEIAQAFAEQAVIAIAGAKTLRELRERTAELAERNDAYSERIEHQAATIDVLKAMSASPGDPQPVFDLIAVRARDMCGAYGVTVCEFDGALLHWRAATGVSEDPAVRAAAQADFPRPPARDWPSPRAILDRAIVHIRDHDADLELRRSPVWDTVKSSVGVPMMRGGVPIGVVHMGSREKGGFSDTQVELLKTFAEQAVIAISSAETYRALQTRTADLRESLEYQTGTSDVLKVISRSTFDLQPVLLAVAETAARLCGADQAMVDRYENGMLEVLANYGFPPEFDSYQKERGKFPADKDSPASSARAIHERRAIHIEDAAAIPGYPEMALQLGKQRTSLAVPLLRQGEPIGVIVLARQRVEPFNERQVELVSTFADQAVIAIENTRLLTEQREALEQQTATAEVLGVINANPGALAPVFEAILEKAHALCGAQVGALGSFDGTHWLALATHGYSEQAAAWLGKPFLPSKIHDPLFKGERLHVPDAKTYPWTADDDVPHMFLAEAGLNTMLMVPLLRDGACVGFISAASYEARPFTEKEIALLENFAAQAVIAMENARLLGELRERTGDLQQSLEYQTATSEVLNVISHTTFDLQPVFDTIVATAARLCDSSYANITIRVGDFFHGVAEIGLRPGDPAMSDRVFSLNRETVTGRVALAKQVVQVADIAADPEYVLTGDARRSGVGTVLGVPLIRDDVVVGTLNLGRRMVQPFTDRQIELVRTFADQAVIAIENTRLMTEQREALEQQTATAEVLQVINASPGDLAPVFQTMLDSALRLCGAAFGELARIDGEITTPVAVSGMPTAFSQVRMSSELRPGPGTASWQIRHGENLVHIGDLMHTETYRDGDPVRRLLVDDGGARALLAVPLRKDDALLGLISIFRQEPGAFTDKQIALLENFAAQAVIAMDNARLLTELRLRTGDLEESLRYQTAISDVLSIISRSSADVQPVLDNLVETAALLCDAEMAMITRCDSEVMWLGANHGYPAELWAHWLAQGPLPLDPRAVTVGMRTLTEGRVVHVHDVSLVPGYPVPHLALGGLRTILGVPLRNGDRTVGHIGLARGRVEPFTDRQVALLENFAAQAVIAMENARLLTEQREALERQTATAEVLEVINASPGDLTPVFDAVLEKALRLCGASIGGIYSYNGTQFEPSAFRGITPEFATFDPGRPLTLNPGGMLDTLLRTRAPVQEPDLMNTERYRNNNPYTRALVDFGGIRALLDVPLLKDGGVIGVITIFRTEAGAFSDKQIALLENFAAQAVIAMENARLLTEQREALERQTAMAEVLRITNENPGDLKPVFDAVMEHSLRLVGAAFGALYTYDDERFHMAAIKGVPPEFEDYRRRHPQPLGSDSPPGQLLATKRPVQVVDNMTHPFFVANPDERDAQIKLGGVRAVLALPLLKDGAVVGQLVIYRKDPGVFPDKQVALLESFAAQAVIAMENARLLTETREALEQQTATAEVLQVINASPGELAPVFDAMLERALRLCGAAFGMLYTLDGELFQVAASKGVPAAFDALRRQNPATGFPPGSPPVEALVTRRPTQVVDVMTHPFFVAHPDRQNVQINLGGIRAVLNLPLLKDEAVVGMFVIYRKEPGAFPDKQIALLGNFAAQAVIAMESARLLTEQREALEQQTATAEVLEVINASPGDLAPVFEAILEKAHRICRFDHGGLALFDGTYFRSVATRGYGETGDAVSRVPYRPSGAQRLVLRGARYGHIPDISAFSAEPDDTVFTDFIALTGFRATLLVPLRKDDAVIGHISGWRLEAGPFSDKEIALLENFAAQAVIAIENARLLTETREALEQQTATAEVLQVINASPGDLTPVFDVILEKAHALCGAEIGALTSYDGDFMRAVAVRGLAPEQAALVTEPYRPSPGGGVQQLIDGARFSQMPDILASNLPGFGGTFARLTGLRTYLGIPLRKDGVFVGQISAYRREVRPFAEKEIVLLESFAGQAVIAMENARLLTETREALEQQTATAEVLQVINANPGDLTPVFDAILEKSLRICRSAFGVLAILDGGDAYRLVSERGVTPALAEYRARNPARGISANLRQAMETLRPVHQLDIREGEGYRLGQPGPRSTADLGGARTLLIVPLLKGRTAIGAIQIFRQEVRAFSEKEIASLENFAAQAVIAMENARLLNEVRQRQEELRITFENMGDGVAMFDAEPRLVAWNNKFQEIFAVPADLLEQRQTYADYIRFLGQRGDYGPDTDVEDTVRRVTESTGQQRVYERTRPDGRIIEIRSNPVDSGGFVLIFADITERKRNEAAIAAARDAAEEATRTIEAAYRDLKIAQANLVQAEKMASLGQLTAGIAHEIKNPLNFVNNFASLSVELLDEFKEAAAPGLEHLTDDQRAEVDDLSTMLTSNLKKIEEHGKRADGIVKAMLEHSRGASGERRAVDLNALVDEALNLAYHGARAQNQSFNITLERDFASGLAPLEVNPQDMTRVFLNLFGNGFYAANKRAQESRAPGFEPTLRVTTIDRRDSIEVQVRDNGTGIPPDIRDKLFEPFFTTKPTGEGTGLGLSITYDIVTKQHGGGIAVESEVGDHTTFSVTLPRQMFAPAGGVV